MIKRKYSLIFLNSVALIATSSAFANCPNPSEIKVLIDGSHFANTESGKWIQLQNTRAYKALDGVTSFLRLGYVFAFHIEEGAGSSVISNHIICSYGAKDNKIVGLQSVRGQQYLISESQNFDENFSSPGWKRLKNSLTCVEGIGENNSGKCNFKKN
ncbi:DUF3757 domain-containing protein [Fluviispira multicolorata]|uniref:Uncharacterized protein n=1 Tax=Fluviispira multicolorata TaxID=2654512 RepID=A0A833JE97_9BACT|nr:DUF3757 domain-containing protein [Fluviispira multicolorata]KAB8032280.1 hypothetical protein GCL57_06425 [Fluviispira multicolorata]